MIGKTWLHHALRVLEELDPYEGRSLTQLAQSLRTNTGYLKRVLLLLREAGFIEFQEKTESPCGIRGRPPKTIVRLTAEGEKTRYIVITLWKIVETALNNGGVSTIKKILEKAPKEPQEGYENAIDLLLKISKGKRKGRA